MTLRIILLLGVQRYLYGTCGLFGKYLKCLLCLRKGEDNARHGPYALPEEWIPEDSCSSLAGSVGFHFGARRSADGSFTDGDAEEIHSVIIVQK